MYTMKAYKYDGALHYEQPLELFEVNKKYIALKGHIGRELTHYTRDTVYTFDKETIEYFFFDKWYTAAFVFNDESICDYVYCNICLPSTLANQVVSFIDLDIDVIYYKGEVKVVDIDEFEEHLITYKYPKKTIAKVKEVTEEVILAIKSKKFPFNLYLEKKREKASP